MLPGIVSNCWRVQLDAGVPLDDLLAELLTDIDTENDAVRSLLDELAQAPDLPFGEDNGPPPEVTIPEMFQVVVECVDEDQQQAVYKRLADEGLKCRLLMW